MLVKVLRGALVTKVIAHDHVVQAACLPLRTSRAVRIPLIIAFPSLVPRELCFKDVLHCYHEALLVFIFRELYATDPRRERPRHALLCDRGSASLPRDFLAWRLAAARPRHGGVRFGEPCRPGKFRRARFALGHRKLSSPHRVARKGVRFAAKPSVTPRRQWLFTQVDKTFVDGGFAVFL